jgi:superfamily II DNA or RNA helicase/HKD family nuclease
VQQPAHGILEALLDQELDAILKAHPEFRTIFDKIDPEEEPARYSAFVAKVIEKALRLENDPDRRLALCNEIIDRITSNPAADGLRGRRLVAREKPVLLQITPPHFGDVRMPRPETPLTESTLFTGSPADPQLVNELLQELLSADAADVLVSFIKWSGLRLLLPGFEDLCRRRGRLRVITTSYMGASEVEAVQVLARLPNAEVRVSYDTERTRLHAKAYHFRRNTGFSTAYIGSANISHAAMTSGLEWNLKITAQDLPHILEKFTAEFETYWNSHDFVRFNPDEPQVLRDAISRARNRTVAAPLFWDIKPHAFQERILDALEVERTVHGQWRNLIVAATGTGKTVVAAFDFKRHFDRTNRQSTLLYIAHRREILEQAVATFRGILRIPDFGELQVGPYTAARMDHLFCSVDMLRSRRLWEQVGRGFYEYIVVDEVHHGPAASYRPVFDEFTPRILLGLTATPERMDGASVMADFGNRFAAEIRLPEALEEKLLCPFHYFGVADEISLKDDRFWKSGRYDVQALEDVYTGHHIQAQQRLDAIVTALTRFEPDLIRVRGIGFCVSVRHAEFMAEAFNRQGITSGVLIGGTAEDDRTELVKQFRAGKFTFIFTCDVFNEGVDVPEVNTVLFLRPTESLTVFLQQLGRGLRHAEGKDCLTVLDFVGQAHRRYRVDRKLKTLLSRTRFNIEREVELSFPHLPPGCAIQFDRVARQNVLENIRENLRRLSDQIPERLATFEAESSQLLTFANFIRYHDYAPAEILSKATWGGWLARARLKSPVQDPDEQRLLNGLVRAAQITGPRELKQTGEVVSRLRQGQVNAALERAGNTAVSLHYRFWGKPGKDLGLGSLQESFDRLSRNPGFLDDLVQVLDWADSESRVGGQSVDLPFPCPLELHAQYSATDIKAALGMATFDKPGMTGVGLLDCPELKAYIVLITFQKTEREFSPSTMYADYPMSRNLLHWESPSNTTQNSTTGQNLIHHQARGYTMLFFARSTKRDIGGSPAPFVYLGPGGRVSFEDERPIKMTWELRCLMPAEMFEENRRGG